MNSAALFWGFCALFFVSFFLLVYLFVRQKGGSPGVREELTSEGPGAGEINMGKYVRYAAWGYLFVYIYIRVNGWDLLPGFVGWLLLYAAVRALTAERPTLAVLKGFAVVLCLWAVLQWPPVEWPEGLTQLLSPVTLVLSLTGMYFHFQFLTEMAALAEKYGDFMIKPGLSQKLLRARTVCVVLQTAVVLVSALPLEEGYLAVVMVVIAAIWWCFCLYAMWALFTLARGLDAVRREIA